jgi:Tfp pilus assembly protein PilX
MKETILPAGAGGVLAPAGRSIGACRQRGTVLAVSLLMLVVVTLLAVTAMTQANLDLRLASNGQARAAALAQAENALVDAETLIVANFQSGPPVSWSSDGTDGFFMLEDLRALGRSRNVTLTTTEQAANPPPQLAVKVVDWDAANGTFEDGASGGRYTVEYLGAFTGRGGSLAVGTGGSANQRHLYRITARGAAGGGGVRFLESIFVSSD